MSARSLSESDYLHAIIESRDADLKRLDALLREANEEIGAVGERLYQARMRIADLEARIGSRDFNSWAYAKERDT